MMAQTAARTAATPVLARLMNLLSPPGARDRSDVGSDEGFSTATRCPLLMAEGLPLECDVRNLAAMPVARTGDRYTPEGLMLGHAINPWYCARRTASVRLCACSLR